MKEYYIVIFIFNEIRYYTLWFSAEEDGFVLDVTGTRVRVWENELSVKEFVSRSNYILQDEKTEILCDESTLLNFTNMDCNSLNTFWNVVSDMANSLKIPFLGDDKNTAIQDIYSKVFYGCNLPAIKRDGEEFVPDWNQSEKELLFCIVKDGRNILQEQLRI